MPLLIGISLRETAGPEPRGNLFDIYQFGARLQWCLLAVLYI